MQKYHRLFFLLAAIILLLIGAVPNVVAHSARKDTSIATVIKGQLALHRKELYFPNSVQRFYRHTGFKLAWIAPDTVKTHATDAMLLLDCVVTYGLKHADYHPDQLLYDKLKLLRSSTGPVSNRQKAMFDILLTDAILAFENNLHYGRLNPTYPAAKIDLGIKDGFDAEKVLMKALKSQQFEKEISKVQPQTKAYTSLKHRMYLMKGLYELDCYEFSEADVQCVAINMERLRWYNTRKKTDIAINIPSGILTVHTKNNDQYFKIKIDKPGMDQLEASLDYAKVTIGTAKGQLFLQITRPGYQKQGEPIIKTLANKDTILIPISVVGGAKLLALLSNIGKKQPDPVSLTYLTCEIKNGQLVTYQDNFHADQKLKKALYKVNKP
jgi:murein L,D-transpeptidase YcbB/YkuD